MMPGSPNAIAAIVGLLMLSVQFRDMEAHARSTWLVILGVLLTLLASFAAHSAVSGDVFAGQPAFEKLFGRGPAPVASMMVGTIPLLAALVWRHRDPHATSPKLAVGTGACLTVFCYLGGHWVGIFDDVPFLIGLDTLEDSVFLGDRVAAAIAMIPLLLAALSPLLLVEWGRAGRARAVAALVFWGSVLLPGVVLALYVAPSAEWYRVLEPLKIVLLLNAGTLVLGVGGGLWMASKQRQPMAVERPRPSVEV